MRKRMIFFSCKRLLKDFFIDQEVGDDGDEEKTKYYLIWSSGDEPVKGLITQRAVRSFVFLFVFLFSFVQIHLY